MPAQEAEDVARHLDSFLRDHGQRKMASASDHSDRAGTGIRSRAVRGRRRPGFPSPGRRRARTGCSAGTSFRPHSTRVAICAVRTGNSTASPWSILPLLLTAGQEGSALPSLGSRRQAFGAGPRSWLHEQFASSVAPMAPTIVVPMTCDAGVRSFLDGCHPWRRTTSSEPAMTRTIAPRASQSASAPGPAALSAEDGCSGAGCGETPGSSWTRATGPMVSSQAA
jgi:hypothetical protein